MPRTTIWGMAADPPKFRFVVSLDVVLTAKEIWPEGNAPAKPTVADVEKMFYVAGRSGSAIVSTLRAWDMTEDVTLDIFEEPT
jgi:hypothetical protein